MDCVFFREEIVLNSYDKLDASVKKALKAHLQICRECQQFQVSLSETQQALDQWTKADRPTNIESLYKAMQLKPLSRRFQLPAQRRFSWKMAIGMILSLGFSALAWISINVKWKKS